MEIWKDLIDNNLYMVSNYGRVKKKACATNNEFILKQTDNGLGYKQVKLKYYIGENNVVRRKKKYVHRLVAEAFIDNPNNFPEVNHKDHNRGNNKLENLEWVTREQNVADMVEYNISIGRYNEKTKNFCIDCGKEINKKAIRCQSCNGIYFNKTHKKQRQESLNIKSDEEERLIIKDLIRTLPFTKIGKMYGVTDNSIRKRCKTYNLPFRKKDIEQYTDEEWKLV